MAQRWRAYNPSLSKQELRSIPFPFPSPSCPFKKVSAASSSPSSMRLKKVAFLLASGSASNSNSSAISDPKSKSVVVLPSHSHQYQYAAAEVQGDSPSLVPHDDQELALWIQHITPTGSTVGSPLCVFDSMAHDALPVVAVTAGELHFVGDRGRAFELFV